MQKHTAELNWKEDKKMANRNFQGTQINQSATIVEKAGVDMPDVRNRIMSYHTDGFVRFAPTGTAMPLGIAIMEAGINDISGRESGMAKSGDDVDIQIKDIGYVLAGDEIAKGDEVASLDGMAVKAAPGDYVLGIALSAAEKDSYCKVQISKYQKQ